MTNPSISCSKEKLRHNAREILKMCKEMNIDATFVTKVFCAHPQIAKIVMDEGYKTVADSRIENLKKLSFLNCEKILLRLPMISQAYDVVKYSDISLNSEIETVKALSSAAKLQNKVHKIIIMVDLGDLREGLLPQDAISFASKVNMLSNIHIVGVGVNLNCYGGVIPNEENLESLVLIAKNIESILNIKLSIISGGNSGSIHLIKNGKMPSEINNVRIGEAILRGVETSYQNQIENMFKDVFVFKGEIVELKEKPSVPFGEMGLNAFGQKPQFEDVGIHKRAILAFGRQDVLPDQITPYDSNIKILGASSDHTIVDITNSKKDYKVGDVIEFDLTYGGILSSFTSEYVVKIID